MISNYLSLVKFSHTVFALPFALVGFTLGIHSTEGFFSWKIFLLVIACMVTARTAAMAFNRWLDQNYDKENPRTAQREIPAGILSSSSVLIFIILNSILFIACSYFINDLCFLLSPIALFIILGYSYTKRFTSFCHFVLGLGLSLAPIGAYLAVTNRFDIIPLIYSLAVLLWVSGFDIIYALQDEEFDKSLGLNSIPTLIGKSQALWLSRFIHGLCAITMIAASILVEKKYDDTSFIHFIGLTLFLSMLFYQHTLVSSNDLSKINLAFFSTNGLASVFFGSAFILDFLW